MKLFTILFCSFVCSEYLYAVSGDFIRINENEGWITDLDALPTKLSLKYKQKIKNAKKARGQKSYNPKNDITEDLVEILQIYNLEPNVKVLDLSDPKSLGKFKITKAFLWIHLNNKSKGDCWNYPDTYLELKFAKKPGVFAGILLPKEGQIKKIELKGKRDIVKEFAHKVLKNKHVKRGFDDYWDYSPQNPKRINPVEYFYKATNAFQLNDKEVLLWSISPVSEVGEVHFFAIQDKVNGLQVKESVAHTTCGI